MSAGNKLQLLQNCAMAADTILSLSSIFRHDLDE